MFFRITDLELKKNYAGFKKCWVTTGSSRDMAPFGSAFPAEAHGEVEVIVVCSLLSPKPNEEALDISANLKHMQEYTSYGFMSYRDQVRTELSHTPLQTFLSRIPQNADGFAAIPGFEDWTPERVEETFMTKGGMVPFLMPRRWVLDKGLLQMDFYLPLDSHLPNGNFRIAQDKNKGMVFVPLTEDEALPPQSGVTSIPVERSFNWIVESRLVALPMPEPHEYSVLAASGITSLAVVGASVDAAAAETAGIRSIQLQVSGEEELREFINFFREAEGAVGVCGDRPNNIGTLLAIALVAGGKSVEEASTHLHNTYPLQRLSCGMGRFRANGVSVQGSGPVGLRSLCGVRRSTF